ncbi:MAG: response regulator [Novosphingobium sp.]
MNKLANLEGVRVLVAEDEYFIAFDLVEALREAGADLVGPVATLAEAQARFDEGGIDVAVLDMNLHGEKVFPFAERLEAQHVPYVIVSGYSRDALPLSLRSAPHLEKPVACDRIIAAVIERLAREKGWLARKIPVAIDAIDAKMPGETR